MARDEAPPPEPTPFRAPAEPVRPETNGPPTLPRPETTAPVHRTDPAASEVGLFDPATQAEHSIPPAEPRAAGPAFGWSGDQPGESSEEARPARPGTSEVPDRPTPRTVADDLSPDQLLARPPGGPALGWQAMVYRLSGGRLRPAPGPAEIAQQQMQTRIGVPLAGCHRIAVVALKGGVGKTTTTACLGAIFAEHRGDRVVAVDANPDPGTLGYRIRRDTLRTAKDLLADADELERYADVRAYASQTDLRLEVIAGEADPGSSEVFDEDDYREVAAVLERFYSLILTDCGPGLLHSAMRAILPAADQLVVVSPPSLDGARSASLTLDWLEQHGYEQLARSSVVVINAVRERGLVDVDKLQEHFARRCRAVVRVPFDRHLETGAEIVLDELAPATRRAYIRLAAAVADGFGGKPLERGPS